MPDIQTPEVQPTVEQQPKPFHYEYQPTDEYGRPMGGKQVIEADNPEQGLEIIANNHIESMRHIRDLNRRARTGELEQEQIPDSAERVVDEQQVQFGPVELTDEEKFQLQQSMMDPSRIDETRELLAKSMFGAPAAQVSKALQQVSSNAQSQAAFIEARAFVNDHPEFYNCDENINTIVRWMQKNKLKPVKANFELANTTLREAALLLEAPTAAEATPDETQSESQPTGRITREEVVQQRRPAHSSSGLSRSNSSSAGSSPRRGFPSKAEIDAMEIGEYTKWSRVAGFLDYVNKLPR